MCLLAAAAVAANVFIGTDGKGNTTPAACVPFGMVQAGPDTSPKASEYVYGKEHCSGYQYADRYLWRFSQTHLSGTGVPSNGDIGILPLTEKDSISGVALLKSTESAHPGFYDVTLTNGVRCEMTATPHTSVYRLTDRPWRTAEVVREILATQYAPRPDGLCGNEDCGQMSAWYIFALLGFYPVDPCGGEYVIGAPQVPSVSVDVGGGKVFHIVARGLSEQAKYVKSVTLNGRPITDWKIRHADIVKGGELVFEMCRDGPQRGRIPPDSRK